VSKDLKGFGKPLRSHSPNPDVIRRTWMASRIGLDKKVLAKSGALVCGIWYNGERYSEVSDYFIREVLERGKVLYERGV
jgi:hypothetical protein